MMSYTEVAWPSRAATLDCSDLVKRETLTIQSVSTASRKRCVVLDKVSKAHFFIVERDIQGVPRIIHLGSARSPPQVTALVALVIVYPIDFHAEFVGFLDVPDGPHVVNEDDRVVELLGQFDSAATVVSVLPIGRVVTTSADREPLASQPLVDFIRHPPPHVLYDLLPGRPVRALHAPRRQTLANVVPHG